MGKKSRNKGYRGEHNLVSLLRSHKINAIRVPLSGATEFCKGDLIIDDLIAEVKVRQNGFKELYKWIENKDLLFVKADRHEYLCIMPLKIFMKLKENNNARTV
jgi:hypothetical protein